MNDNFGLIKLTDINHSFVETIDRLSNNFFSSSKDLLKFAEKLENGCIISGRCPSMKFNLIHLRFYQILAQIQQKLDIDILIPIATDEVFLQKSYDSKNPMDRRLDLYKNGELLLSDNFSNRELNNHYYFKVEYS